MMIHLHSVDKLKFIVKAYIHTLTEFLFASYVDFSFYLLHNKLVSDKDGMLVIIKKIIHQNSTCDK